MNYSGIGGALQGSLWPGCPQLDTTPGHRLSSCQGYVWEGGVLTDISLLPCGAKMQPVIPGLCATCLSLQQAERTADQ